MIIERAQNPAFVSNTYLVTGDEGGDKTAVLIDAGGPVAPLLATIERRGLELSHVLLTHHHHDHVCELGAVLARHPDATVLAHPLEAELIEAETEPWLPGATLSTGDLTIEPLHTPGHTAGMLSLLVNGEAVFTGDTLFKGSVGGVRAPGHTTYADLRHSIMDVLLGLAPATAVHPGHMDPTTIAQETEHNAFVRVWRGLDPEGAEPCTALGEPATLVLWAPDYDGGHKAWVRWADGSDDIVPGSRVERE